MKTEKEIRELFEKLDNHKLIDELSKKNFIDYTDKGGHWLDCLAWILDEEEK